MMLPGHVFQFWAVHAVLSAAVLTSVGAVVRDELYAFGADAGDTVLPKGNDAYLSVNLETPVNLFGETYSTVFVSTNGLVSFLTPLESFINIQFPLNIPVIAPLYANADTSRKGQVYYRSSGSEADLVTSLNTLRRLFPNLSSDFQPVGVFIVTWENVGMFSDDGSDKGNTFQLIITTDGESTFVEFLYLDGGIQWIQAPNLISDDPSVRAQAGIVSPSGKLFTLRGSGSDQVINLDKWTNGDKQGQYVFKIGNVDVDGSGIVEQPHVSLPDYGDSLAKSCAEGYVGCHSDADCVDAASGVCCTCRPLYIGNGLSCLKKDMPIRLGGPLSINLNGVRMENLIFEGYIVVKDGRVYTAVDSLPSALGPAMQFLKPLESVPGWLFAVTPEESLKNGFQLTGAVLNHTAHLTFSPQHVVRIRQIFKGPDAFDQIKVEIEISGRIKEFSSDIGMKHPEYEEIYTKTAPGEYRSTGAHKYQLNSGESMEVLVEQTIQFKENCHSEEESTPQRLVSNRNYMTYKDPILRLAGFHRLGGGPVLEDPCIEGKAQCVANSSCLVEGDSFKCVCNSGYGTDCFQSEYYGDSGDQLGCIDINECQDRTANCHENAICLNEIGSFSCRCHSGYSGDGTHCESDELAATQPTILPGAIPANMHCADNQNIETCRCAQGYEIQYENNGLGIICVDIDECARLSQACSTYASCINMEGGFECRCHQGFRGDGRDCDPSGCSTIACPEGSVCDETSGSPQCVCPPGYTGAPPSCFPQSKDPYSQEESPTCDTISCPAGSVCDERSGYPQCRCPPGTFGSPPSCFRQSQDSSASDHCTTHSDCPPLARCSGSLLGPNICTCLDGSTVSPSGRCPVVHSLPVVTASSDRLFKTCYERRCWCPPGFVDDGQYCVKTGIAPQPQPEPIPPQTQPPIIHEEDPTSCHVLNNCHRFASCIAAMSVDDGFRCMCNPGYEGDGYNCSESDISCSEADICHKNAVCMADEQTSKYVCICSDGYVGDGYICYPTGQCTEDTDCGDFGVCEYNEDKEAHECGCKQGYMKASGVCVPEKSSVSCSECDQNASCVEKDGVDICQCDDGYQGDGFTCYRIVQGCDTLRNCDPNAKCLYQPDETGYRCKCNEGFEGDGLTCEEILTCYNDESLCHQNAVCIYLDNKYKCKCNEGFFGNGTVCKEAAQQKEEFLLLTKGGSILKVPFSPTRDDPGVPINIHGSQVAVGITTDCVEGKVYWSDLSQAVIKRAKYDGSEFEEFLETKGESPEGLALDWVNRQIYWTDSLTDKISSANLDTKEVKVIINKNLTNPRGIAVHPFRRRLYWSDWNREDPKIEESDLDGSRRRVVVNGHNVKLPNALTIDWDRDELCWSNAGTKTIDCMYLNRRVPNTVVDKAPYPFGLAVSSDKYYWSDWSTLKIMSAPKVGGAPIATIDVPLGGDDKPYGLAAAMACPR